MKSTKSVKNTNILQPGNRAFSIVATLVLLPGIAYGHDGGGIPHIHANGVELLLVWLVVVIALIPTGLFKHR